MVEQWNNNGENSGTADGGTVMEEQQNICWWNRGTFDDGTVEQSRWQSTTYVRVRGRVRVRDKLG